MPHGEYPKADMGKCRSCGFLSKHARSAAGLPSPRFYEVEHPERTHPDSMRMHTVGYGMRADTEPMCFLGKVNLMEILQFKGDAKLVEAIMADRKCDGWYPYMPGLGPIEHYDQMNWQLFHKALDDERSMREQSYRRQDRALIITGLILGASEIITGIILAVVLSYRESYIDQILRRLFGE